MGGRGSGGGRSSGGSASKTNSVQDELTQGKINYATNKAYKYEDDAYDYKRQASVEKAMANKLRKKGNLKKAEEYENFSKESKRKQLEAEKKAKQYHREANKLSKTKEKSIPTSYKYEGDNGYSKLIYIHSSSLPKQSDFNIEDENLTTVSFANAPSWAKSQAKKYVNILKLSATYKGVELQNFINEWNLKNPNNKTSYSSLIKMRRRYYEYGVKGLLSRFGNNNGRTTVNDEDFDYFKSLYLKEGAPSLYSCWEITLGHAILEYGVNKFDFPSHMAFRRRMMKEIPQQAIFIARNGKKLYRIR